jgi:hypothetical protein
VNSKALFLFPPEVLLYIICTITETRQGSVEESTKEQDMKFVKKTMLSAKVQDVVTKVDLVGQNLLVATNKCDPQYMRCRSRALQAALAWIMTHLDHVGQRRGWPEVVRDEITGRIQEIAKTPLETLAQRLAHMAPISWGAE